MPLVRGTLHNRRAIVEVGVQSAIDVERSQMHAGTAFQIPETRLRGLIDTGAGISLITEAAATQAGLQSRGKTRIGSVSGIAFHAAYNFTLGIWYDGGNGRGYYQFAPVLGASLNAITDFDVLIGMDVILQGDFTIRRDKTFTWQLGS